LILYASSSRFLQWLTATLFAAFLALGPTAAIAHEGHHAHIAPVTSQTSSSELVRKSLSAPTAPLATRTIKSNASRPIASLDPCNGCEGSCCFGAGCCAVAVAELPTVATPHFRESVIDPISHLARTSAECSNLLEPPNA
jgi:hypothetical protein